MIEPNFYELNWKCPWYLTTGYCKVGNPCSPNECPIFYWLNLLEYEK